MLLKLLLKAGIVHLVIWSLNFLGLNLEGYDISIFHSQNLVAQNKKNMRNKEKFNQSRWVVVEGSLTVAWSLRLSHVLPSIW